MEFYDTKFHCYAEENECNGEPLIRLFIALGFSSESYKLADYLSDTLTKPIEIQVGRRLKPTMRNYPCHREPLTLWVVISLWRKGIRCAKTLRPSYDSTLYNMRLFRLRGSEDNLFEVPNLRQRISYLSE